MNFHKIFSNSFTYKNKTLIADIICSYENEYDLPIDFFDSEYLKKFETGEYLNLVINVRAHYLDEYGEDYLSEVHILAKEMDNQIDETINSHNMVENAIANLKLAIDAKIKLFEDNLGLKFT